MPDNRSMMPSFACMVGADAFGTTVRRRPTLFVDQLMPDASLLSALNRLRQIASPAKPLNALFLVAHIQFADVEVRERNCNLKSPIGIGLGFEGVFHHNVWLWKGIEGHAKTIVVYSCMAARTSPAMRGTFGDMKYLMGGLAIHTRAHVYAADEPQAANVQTQDVDFGPWEGTLFEFPPSGAPPRPVPEAPYNLSEA